MWNTTSDPIYYWDMRNKLPNDFKDLILRPDISVAMTWAMDFDTLRTIGMKHTCNIISGLRTEI